MRVREAGSGRPLTLTWAIAGLAMMVSVAACKHVSPKSAGTMAGTAPNETGAGPTAPAPPPAPVPAAAAPAPSPPPTAAAVPVPPPAKAAAVESTVRASAPHAQRAPHPTKSPAPRQTPGPQPAPANRGVAEVPAATPALDFKSLQERLRNTSAIGVFTKLSLKNQVDDLLGSFRAYHSGQAQPSLEQLRKRYNDLLAKVVDLLKSEDAPLAATIASSRDVIWAKLADRHQFETL